MNPTTALRAAMATLEDHIEVLETRDWNIEAPDVLAKFVAEALTEVGAALDAVAEALEAE